MKIRKKNITYMSSQISEFTHDSEALLLFWQFADNHGFKEDAKLLDDPAKVRLLLREIGQANYDTHSSLIISEWIYVRSDGF